jgi:superfamily II DNA/RNA helicase
MRWKDATFSASPRPEPERPLPFVLPMLTMLERGRARARMPRTLILEPTRELAAQVHENFEKYGKNHRLNIVLLIGGTSRLRTRTASLSAAPMC